MFFLKLLMEKYDQLAVIIVSSTAGLATTLKIKTHIKLQIAFSFPAGGEGGFYVFVFNGEM